MVRKTLIGVAVQAVVVTVAFAQGGPIGSAAFAEAAQKALVQEYCESDGRFMQCLGVDVKKDGTRCAELMRGNWSFCRSTFMMTAPASIPQEDARAYRDNLAGCLRSGAIAAVGKSAGSVDVCMKERKQ